MKWDMTVSTGMRTCMALNDVGAIGNFYLISPTLPIISMSDPKDQTTIIPHNQQPLVTRTYPTVEELEKVILSSVDAQKQWAKVPLSSRIAIANKFIVSAATRLYRS